MYTRWSSWLLFVCPRSKNGFQNTPCELQLNFAYLSPEDPAASVFVRGMEASWMSAAFCSIEELQYISKEKKRKPFFRQYSLDNSTKKILKDYLWVDLIVVLSEIKMIITDANLYHGCSIELVRADTNTGKDWKKTQMPSLKAPVLKWKHVSLYRLPQVKSCKIGDVWHPLANALVLVSYSCHRVLYKFGFAFIEKPQKIKCCTTDPWPITSVGLNLSESLLMLAKTWCCQGCRITTFGERDAQRCLKWTPWTSAQILRIMF